MKLKAKDVLTALDDLEIADRLRARYFRVWCASTTDDHWDEIRAKLGVVDDVLSELRKAANKEGVDSGKSRT